MHALLQRWDAATYRVDAPTRELDARWGLLLAAAGNSLLWVLIVMAVCYAFGAEAGAPVLLAVGAVVAALSGTCLSLLADAE